MLDNICSEKTREAYIEWSFSDDEYEDPCWSCKRQSQPYHIIGIVKDCPYQDIVQQRPSNIKTSDSRKRCMTFEEE